MTQLTEPDELTRYRDGLAAESDSDRPCVLICGGTGCRAGGGLAVGDAFRDALAGRGLSDGVEVRMTGCHGFCEQGPLVVLQPAGVLYVRVTPEDVEEIIATSIEGNDVVERLTYRDPTTKQRITNESDVPFYAHQQRVVLADNPIRCVRAVEPVHTDTDHRIIDGPQLLDGFVGLCQPPFNAIGVPSELLDGSLDLSGRLLDTSKGLLIGSGAVVAGPENGDGGAHDFLVCGAG